MLHELRIYQAVSSARLQILHRIFAERTLPLMARHGVNVVAGWDTLVGPDTPRLVYLLAFSDLAERQARWDAFYADPEWSYIREALDGERGPLLARTRSEILRPTSYSPLQGGPDDLRALLADIPGSPHIFELRSYEALQSDRLGPLHRRFAEHTIGFFRRAGMMPLAFWDVLLGEQMPRMTYLLAYPDVATRERAWNAFNADPDWIAIRDRTNREEGPMVGRISAALLRPTFWSPVQ
jgi:hypothetical protein